MIWMYILVLSCCALWNPVERHTVVYRGCDKCHHEIGTAERFEQCPVLTVSALCGPGPTAGRWDFTLHLHLTSYLLLNGSHFFRGFFSCLGSAIVLPCFMTRTMVLMLYSLKYHLKSLYRNIVTIKSAGTILLPWHLHRCTTGSVKEEVFQIVI